MDDERTPLLSRAKSYDDPHRQFCLMVGIPPSDSLDKQQHVGPKTLYGRATRHYSKARALHAFMASLSTTALLVQVIIGAAVTALGASESSHIAITFLGASNTVIAGIVAYLKSRGQPMRTRMFKDDLEHVVDEIENSETMWLGISKGVHGYDEIDIGDKVTVRSEVARLMRLYDKAMRSNVLNNPDNYMMGSADGPGFALRARPGVIQPAAPIALPVAAPPPATPAPAATATPAPIVAAVPADDPDESPATAPPKNPVPVPQEAPKDAAKDASKESAVKSDAETSKDTPKETSKDAEGNNDAKLAPVTPAANPDESPASAANPPTSTQPDGETGADKDQATKSPKPADENAK